MIRLKTVIMEHNLNDVGKVARFARSHGLEVFYQPIEQNYNTPEDPTLVRAQPQLAQGPAERPSPPWSVTDRPQAAGVADRQLGAPARGDDPLLPGSRNRC